MRFIMRNLRLTKLEQQEPVSKCDHLSVPQLRVGKQPGREKQPALREPCLPQ